MKQIIPFEKELLFSTKVNEVTSISLEHNISLKDKNIIKGDFIITGDYKMTASSINREKFKFNIPAEISLDDSYEYENVTVDIDNFYYEIVNDDSIKVNIDLYVEADKKNSSIELIDADNDDSDDDKKIIEIEEDNVEERLDDNELVVNNNDNVNLDEAKLEPSVSYKESKIVNLKEDTDDENNGINIFNTDSLNMDTYATYYVYIVKEGDTIEKIIDKFNISKDELGNYNDVADIKKGSKLIIPVNNG